MESVRERFLKIVNHMPTHFRVMHVSNRWDIMIDKLETADDIEAIFKIFSLYKDLRKEFYEYVKNADSNVIVMQDTIYMGKIFYNKNIEFQIDFINVKSIEFLVLKSCYMQYWEDYYDYMKIHKYSMATDYVYQKFVKTIDEKKYHMIPSVTIDDLVNKFDIIIEGLGKLRSMLPNPHDIILDVSRDDVMNLYEKIDELKEYTINLRDQEIEKMKKQKESNCLKENKE